MTPSSTSYLAFVHVAPGLEALLSDELRLLLNTRSKTLAGGVELRLSLADLYLVCGASRLAEGVRVRLKAFHARTFGELEVGLGRLPWPAYLALGATVHVRVTCERSRLWHSGAVKERLEGVLAGRFKARFVREDDASASEETLVEAERPSRESEPTLRVFVRLHEDEVQVSIDAAGERLHRRGYRTMSEKASLRETLASAMVLAVCGAGGPRGTLWDPFCGAGTIPLEALGRARGGLAQAERAFAFEHWPAVASAPQAELRVQSHKRAEERLPPTDLCVIGSDVAERAVSSSLGNLRSFESLYGFDAKGRARFVRGDVLEVAAEVPKGAFVLTNPPYGHRLDADQTLDKVNRLLEERPDLRPAALLVGAQMKRDLPSHFRVAFQTQNGGLNVALRVLS